MRISLKLRVGSPSSPKVTIQKPQANRIEAELGGFNSGDRLNTKDRITFIIHQHLDNPKPRSSELKEKELNRLNMKDRSHKED